MRNSEPWSWEGEKLNVGLRGRIGTYLHYPQGKPRDYSVLLRVSLMYKLLFLGNRFILLGTL